MELSGTGFGHKKFALALAGAGLLLAVACGTSAAPAEPLAKNEAILPVSTQTESAAPAVPSNSTNAESIPVSFTIGNNVGERIPDFAITLVDGSTVTSAELLADRQPTFLFFFETW